MSRLLFVCAAGCAGILGCSNLYGLSDYKTRDSDTSAPGSSGANGPGSPAASITTDGTKPENACTTNAACSAAAGNVNTICVRATGLCESLVTTECPRVFGDPTNEDAIVVGTIVDSNLEAAALLAATELDSAAAGGGLPALQAGGHVRPLVVVSCDGSTKVLDASRHLVDRLHVPAMLGPVGGGDVIDVTQEVSVKGGTLVLTSTAPTSAISNLADDDLTWRAVPSDTQRSGLVIAQIGSLETTLRSTRSLTTVRLGIVHRSDADGVSARDAVASQLVINGRFITDAANVGNVTLDGYAANDASALAAIVSRYASTFRPDLVLVTAPEQVTGFIAPLERALTAARVVNRPYYVLTEAAKTQALLDTVAASDMPPDLRRRLRGVGATADPKSASIWSAFSTRFAIAFQKAPTFADAATYDAMYALAYALSATAAAAPSGTTTAHGLRSLGVGDAVEVGPTGAAAALKVVSTGKSVSLRGASALMQWDPKGDIAAGTIEVWCVGTATGSPSFGASGTSMDVETQVVGGAFVQCQ